MSFCFSSSELLQFLCFFFFLCLCVLIAASAGNSGMTSHTRAEVFVLVYYLPDASTPSFQSVFRPYSYSSLRVLPNVPFFFKSSAFK